jgi:LPPG:FO 2-phospho-L-lactate transferase
VRTWVRTGTAGWCTFQEFMVRERGQGLIEGVEYRGAEQAAPTDEALQAIAGAATIVIGPSNPIASIAPILAVPGMRDALAASRAPVVAVSPIVGGEVLKGPTASFLAFAALECTAAGVADFYGELLDGIVADENVARVATLQTDTRMDDGAARARLAEQTLSFAQALR